METATPEEPVESGSLKSAFLSDSPYSPAPHVDVKAPLSLSMQNDTWTTQPSSPLLLPGTEPQPWLQLVGHAGTPVHSFLFAWLVVWLPWKTLKIREREREIGSQTVMSSLPPPLPPFLFPFLLSSDILSTPPPPSLNFFLFTSLSPSPLLLLSSPPSFLPPLVTPPLPSALSSPLLLSPSSLPPSLPQRASRWGRTGGC